MPIHTRPPRPTTLSATITPSMAWMRWSTIHARMTWSTSSRRASTESNPGALTPGAHLMRTRRECLRLALLAAGAAQLERRVQAADASAVSGVRALVFDTFGTVVDYRSSVIAEGEALGRAKKLRVDWTTFADAWRSGYAPAMSRVRSGELPWTRLDDLHRQVLERLLVEYAITGLTEAEIDRFNKAWHRLKPWPDAVSGLTRLKKKFIIAPLSIGT